MFLLSLLVSQNVLLNLFQHLSCKKDPEINAKPLEDKNSIEATEKFRVT
jgi:hypothetical protein